jgi:hypothetical protein
VGGLGSNWYNIGHGRDSQPVFVPGVDYRNNVSGHTALEGAPGFRPFFNPDAFRVVRDFEIGDVPSTMPNYRAPGLLAVGSVAAQELPHLLGEAVATTAHGGAKPVQQDGIPPVPEMRFFRGLSG